MFVGYLPTYLNDVHPWVFWVLIKTKWIWFLLKKNSPSLIYLHDYAYKGFSKNQDKMKL